MPNTPVWMLYRLALYYFHIALNAYLKARSILVFAQCKLTSSICPWKFQYLHNCNTHHMELYSNVTSKKRLCVKRSRINPLDYHTKLMSVRFLVHAYFVRKGKKWNFVCIWIMVILCFGCSGCDVAFIERNNYI